jgi:hypothetical protein
VSELVLYRPTFVIGNGRGLNPSLLRAAMRILPIYRGGEQPVPLTWIGNVAASAVTLATTPGALPLVALQPWEGMTIAALRHLVAPDGPHIHVFARLLRGIMAGVWWSGRLSPKYAAAARRAGLRIFGQEVRATSLSRLGYVAPVDLGSWQRVLWTREFGSSKFKVSRRPWGRGGAPQPAARQVFDISSLRFHDSQRMNLDVRWDMS